MGNRIICIERRHGSGGEEIAAILSQQLGIRVYDRELVELACMHGELPSKILQSFDEKTANSYLPLKVYEGNHHVKMESSTSAVVFQLQSQIIRRIAQEENCIFIGRCAAHVLQDTNAAILSVFIGASKDHRMLHTAQCSDISKLAAKRAINRIDGQREEYFRTYTQKAWGKAENYDVYIDSGIMTVPEAVQKIAMRYEAMQTEENT